MACKKLESNGAPGSSVDRESDPKSSSPGFIIRGGGRISPKKTYPKGCQVLNYEDLGTDNQCQIWDNQDLRLT